MSRESKTILIITCDICGKKIEYLPKSQAYSLPVVSKLRWEGDSCHRDCDDICRDCSDTLARTIQDLWKK